MIRVEKWESDDRRGIFEWRIPSLGLSGRSRQPLSDACRAIQRTSKVTSQEEIGTYAPGSDVVCMKTTVGVGAALTVAEDSVAGVRFRKWREFDGARFAEAAE